MKQRGDTIIEVLLALTVVGMSLGIAYAITNRSIATGRAAQERTEAVKIAETQLEFLKSLVSDEPSVSLPMYKVAQNYCLVAGVKVLFSDTDSACKSAYNGTLYNIQLKYTADSPDFFESIVTWDLPTSRNQGEVNLRYRP